MIREMRLQSAFRDDNGIQDELELDNALPGEMARLQLGVENNVDATLEGAARAVQTSSVIVSGPPTKGQVELQGRTYQWTLTSEGLQMVPVEVSQNRSSRASSNPGENIFTTRAQSPFVEVDQKDASPQVVNRTPSPSRKRSVDVTWSGRRRSASRSPIRTSPAPSTHAAGRMSATAARNLFDRTSTWMGGRAAKYVAYLLYGCPI